MMTDTKPGSFGSLESIIEGKVGLLTGGLCKRLQRGRRGGRDR